MTDKPTQKEMDDLFVEETGFDPDDFPAAIFGFTRAVLAKWGTPAPVGAEPIGHLYCGGSYGDELADWEIVADQHQCDKLNEHHGSLGKEAKLPIYTTPQPTQPQAGAVPLTCEWTHHADDSFWDTECGQSWRFDDGGPKENNMHFCHHCGKPVHIKGGQHGG